MLVIPDFDVGQLRRDDRYDLQQEMAYARAAEEAAGPLALIALLNSFAEVFLSLHTKNMQLNTAADMRNRTMLMNPNASK